MKSIILAAGIGSRLRPITHTKPKSMIKVAGIPIIEHQVKAYKSIGVQEIIIVVGYYGDKIKSHFAHEKDVSITFIENNDYEHTNNMYSLYLARHAIINSPFYLSNADVVFDPTILSLYTKDESCIFVEKDIYNSESMKVTTDTDGYIQGIAKTISPENANAISIDVYKLNKTDGHTLMSYITHHIEHNQNLKDWTEVALNTLFEQQKINPLAVDINNKKWVEVDDYNDLAIADKKFSSFDLSLQSYDTFIFDLDGTLFLGEKPITDAITQVNALLNSNKDVYFLTNNSSKTKKQYVKKLSNMGLHITVKHIISSLDSLIYFLKQNQITDIFVLGTQHICTYIQDHGINPTSHQPEYVVITYDTDLNYQKLATACQHINNGIDFIATHMDIFCPTPQGAIPDCGAITKMIEITTNKQVKHIFGKPHTNILSQITYNPETTVIIGDRIYTDGVLAQNINAHYILVLSGETTRDMIDKDLNIKIDLCLKTFGDIQII